jgi:hypothetical protein
MDRFSRLAATLQQELDCTVRIEDAYSSDDEQPYLSCKIIASYVPDPAQPVMWHEDEGADVKKMSSSQPSCRLALTALGREREQTDELALRTLHWFVFYGYDVLKRMGYVVAEIGEISNVKEEDDREDLHVRRFEISLRFEQRLERRLESIDEISGMINHSHYQVKE